MTLKSFLILFLTVGCIPLAAQTVLKGRVTTLKGKPLAGVTVKAYKADTLLIKYKRTDAQGRYTLSLQATDSITRVEFVHLGYEKIDTTLEAILENGEVKMDEQAYKLKEVTIKRPPINGRGDTLIYNVKDFTHVSDRNLEDVLRRMPGITVDAGGVIRYQGTPINKFYIEGLDPLGGNYTVASQNIKPDDVTSVSVYQNHQPKKALKNVQLSESAALNIRIKDDRKLKPIGYVSQGVGVAQHFMAQTDLFGMFIGRKTQVLTNIKGNNTGSPYSAPSQLPDDNYTPNDDNMQGLFQNHLSESRRYRPPDMPITGRPWVRSTSCTSLATTSFLIYVPTT